ncbi:hypothetical protein E2C05_20795 [Paracraurococcus ruber]|nr:hypothetical protein E2C05_20795 [Paracraurococcus ruber]
MFKNTGDGYQSYVFDVGTQFGLGSVTLKFTNNGTSKSLSESFFISVSNDSLLAQVNSDNTWKSNYIQARKISTGALEFYVTDPTKVTSIAFDADGAFTVSGIALPLSLLQTQGQHVSATLNANALQLGSTFDVAYRSGGVVKYARLEVMDGSTGSSATSSDGTPTYAISSSVLGASASTQAAEIVKAFKSISGLTASANGAELTFDAVSTSGTDGVLKVTPGARLATTASAATLAAETAAVAAEAAANTAAATAASVATAAQATATTANATLSTANATLVSKQSALGTAQAASTTANATLSSADATLASKQSALAAAGNGAATASAAKATADANLSTATSALGAAQTAADTANAALTVANTNLSTKATSLSSAQAAAAGPDAALVTATQTATAKAAAATAAQAAAAAAAAALAQATTTAAAKSAVATAAASDAASKQAAAVAAQQALAATATASGSTQSAGAIAGWDAVQSRILAAKGVVRAALDYFNAEEDDALSRLSMLESGDASGADLSSTGAGAEGGTDTVTYGNLERLRAMLAQRDAFASGIPTTNGSMETSLGLLRQAAQTTREAVSKTGELPVTSARGTVHDDQTDGSHPVVLGATDRKLAAAAYRSNVVMMRPARASSAFGAEMSVPSDLTDPAGLRVRSANGR